MISPGKKYDEKYFRYHLQYHRPWQIKIASDIINRYNIKSLVDLGCGIGSIIEGSLYEHIEVLGIEQNYFTAKKYMIGKVMSSIIKRDITKSINLDKQYDCVISLEVAEHLPESSENVFIKNLVDSSSRLLIITAAGPGQRDPRHINLKPKQYWIDLIVSKNMVYLSEEVEKTKKIWKEKGVPKYMQNNLMIFQKKDIMIIAYPDDEIIFGYKFLNQNIKVICLAGGNRTRKKEFIKSMQCFGITDYNIYDFDDSINSYTKNDIIPILLKEIKGYGKIITHNKNGEYGQKFHKLIYNSMLDITKDFWVFNLEQEKDKNKIIKHFLEIHRSQNHIIKKPKIRKWIGSSDIIHQKNFIGFSDIKRKKNLIGKHKFLIYTSCGGKDRYCYWAQTLHDSLREIGGYDQDFIIFTDRKDFFKDKLNHRNTKIIDLNLDQGWKYNHHRFNAHEFFNHNDYDYIIYLDSDIVCVNSFTPIMRFAQKNLHNKIGYIRERILQKNRYYNKTFDLFNKSSLYKNKYGINAGFFICSSSVYSEYMYMWKNLYEKCVSMKKSLYKTNQTMFNFLIENKDFEAVQLPDYYVEFPFYYLEKKQSNEYDKRIDVTTNILYHYTGICDENVHKRMKECYRYYAANAKSFSGIETYLKKKYSKQACASDYKKNDVINSWPKYYGSSKKSIQEFWASNKDRQYIANYLYPNIASSFNSDYVPKILDIGVQYYNRFQKTLFKKNIEYWQIDKKPSKMFASWRKDGKEKISYYKKESPKKAPINSARDYYIEASIIDKNAIQTTYIKEYFDVIFSLGVLSCIDFNESEVIAFFENILYMLKDNGLFVLKIDNIKMKHISFEIKDELIHKYFEPFCFMGYDKNFLYNSKEDLEYTIHFLKKKIISY